MINVSNNFKDLMADQQDFKQTAEITFLNGTVLNLTEEDFTITNNSLLDSAGANGIPLGVAVSRNIQLEIMNEDDHLLNYDFYGAKIKLYLTFINSAEKIKALGDKYGHILATKYGKALLAQRCEESDVSVVGTIDFGIFTVTQPESYGSVVTIIGYDDMYKCDKAYSTKLIFPATAKSVLLDICDQCGILPGNTNFFNNDFIIKTQPSGDYTHRQIIGYIAMIAAGNARINRQGYLEIMTYNFDYSSGNYHDLKDYNTLSPATSDVSVTGVQTKKTVIVKNTDDKSNTEKSENDTDADGNDTDGSDTDTNESSTEKEETVLVGKEGYVLSVENPLAKGQEDTLINSIYNKFQGAHFRPFTIESIAYPIAEFMDLAKVTDWRGNSFYTVLTDITFTFAGYTTMQCSAESGMRNQGQYVAPSTPAIIKAKNLVENERTARELAVKRLNQALKNSSGMYSTAEKQEDGSTIYYLHDKPTIAESQNVIKLTSEAIGFSTDGGKNYPYGFMITGDMITRLLYAEGINADYINAGAITIKDTNGNIIFQVDMDTGRVYISGDNITIGGKKLSNAISDSTNDAKKYTDGKLTQDEILKRLTNNYQWKGIYKNENGMFISFDYARGGALSLGGKGLTYGDGSMHVYNFFNKEIVSIDQNGIVVNNYLLGTNGNETPQSYTCLAPGLFKDGIFVSKNKNGSGKSTIISPSYIKIKDNTDTADSLNFKNGLEITEDGINVSNGIGSLSVFYVSRNHNKAYVSASEFDVYGDFAVSGTKNRIVNTNNYNKRLQYCYEMPTPHFGDIGTARIDDTGECYIAIDDIFSETVNTNTEYYVFLQKEGKGDLWIKEKTPTYFVVQGTENLKFSWELKAVQKDYEFERLEKFDNSKKEETIDYEKQYIKEIKDFIKEQEQVLNETVK